MIRGAAIIAGIGVFVSLIAETAIIALESLDMLNSDDTEFGVAGAVGLPIAFMALAVGLATIWGVWQLVRENRWRPLLAADLLDVALVIVVLAPSVVYDPAGILATPIRASALLFGIVGAALVASPAVRRPVSTLPNAASVL